MQFPQPPSSPLSPAQFPGGKVPKRVRVVTDAKKLITERKFREALKELAELSDARRPDAEVLFLKALCFEGLVQMRDAERLARESLKIHPSADARMIVARALRQRGATDECLALCDEVIARHPGHRNAVYIKLCALEEAGRIDEAEAGLQPLIDESTRGGAPMPLPLADLHAKILVHRKRYDDAIATLDPLLSSPDTHDELRRLQYYLAAKAHDRAGRYAEAFEAATRANEIGRVPYDPRVHEQQVDTLIENWSAENMAKFPMSACESEMPVFVAGMPRSGTSLIDQIIDAHPKAAGVGELALIESFAGMLSQVWDPDKPAGKQFGKYDSYRFTRVANDYVKHITEASPPGAERVVNKALGNNKLVGLISRLFPKTRIIHAIRDPRDVAVSCYMGGFNNRLHAWTTRLDWTSFSWNQSMRMMEHWKRTIDVPILDVHYEELVRDPQTQFPRIIEFLGLEWDDRCFDFYKSKRTVRTLSYDQVNRPLYTSSAGRNANYAAFLEGVDFAEYDPHG